MKKLIPLFFLLNFFNCTAQQYISFPVANATWRENAFNGSGVNSSDSYFYELNMFGDTVLNALTYHLIQMSGYGIEHVWGGGTYTTGVPTDISFGYGVIPIREDSMRHIYYYNFGTGTEYLLYDFNLTLGSFLPVTALNHGSSNVVVAIDSININGIYHKRYEIADTSDLSQPFAAWIEGIGSTQGLTGGQLHETIPPFEVYSWLVCFAENGNTTLIDTLASQADCDLLNHVTDLNITAGSNLQLVPNPTTGIIKLGNISSAIDTMEFFDLQGKRMDVPASCTLLTAHCELLCPGIYFVKVTAGEKIFFGKFIKQ